MCYSVLTLSLFLLFSFYFVENILFSLCLHSISSNTNEEEQVFNSWLCILEADVCLRSLAWRHKMKISLELKFLPIVLIPPSLAACVTMHLDGKHYRWLEKQWGEVLVILEVMPSMTIKHILWFCFFQGLMILPLMGPVLVSKWECWI